MGIHLNLQSLQSTHFVWKSLCLLFQRVNLACCVAFSEEVDIIVVTFSICRPSASPFLVRSLNFFPIRPINLKRYRSIDHAENKWSALRTVTLLNQIFVLLPIFHSWVNFFYIRRHVSFCRVLLFFINSPYNTIWSWHVIKTNSSHDVVFYYRTKQSAIKLFLYKIWFYSWSHYQTDFHVK